MVSCAKVNVKVHESIRKCQNCVEVYESVWKCMKVYESV